MSRKPSDAKPGFDVAPHPLPQSGGSFIVTDGVLIPDGPAAAAPPDNAPDKPAVKPASKEV